MYPSVSKCFLKKLKPYSNKSKRRGNPIALRGNLKQGKPYHATDIFTM